MNVKIKDYKDVETIKECLEHGLLDRFDLLRSSDDYSYYYFEGDNFNIEFPEDQDDKIDNYYLVTVLSIENCSFSDKLDYMYMLNVWFNFIELLNQEGIDYSYYISDDAEDEKLNFIQALELFMKLFKKN